MEKLFVRLPGEPAIKPAVSARPISGTPREAMSDRDLLLIVDMISSWDFEGAEGMDEQAADAVEAIARIKRAAGDEIPVAYANDLEDGFHGSREIAVATAMTDRRPDLVEPLIPGPSDAFIHKGQHSAFYGTPLAHMLKLAGTENIVLVGQVTEQCILYTALDAHVRGYKVTVPVDAVVSQVPRLGAAALEMIETNMSGRLTTSDELFVRH